MLLNNKIINGEIMTIISIANQKGGVGKTTITLNLAHALVEKGYDVLVIDLDLSLIYLLEYWEWIY